PKKMSSISAAVRLRMFESFCTSRTVKLFPERSFILRYSVDRLTPKRPATSSTVRPCSTSFARNLFTCTIQRFPPPVPSHIMRLSVSIVHVVFSRVKYLFSVTCDNGFFGRLSLLHFCDL